MGRHVKVGLFLLAAVAILVGFNVLYQAVNTLNQLDYIERERDNWQRPADIIRELNLKPGSTVADLGCGSGYFSLKLSSAVGVGGRVVAVDIRRLSLAFLWIRSVLRGAHNVSVTHGEPNNPRLPASLDSVLIVNTYHELTAPEAILDSARRSLVPGGRLVVVDHAPQENEVAQLHEKAASEVESQLVQNGFEIIRREDRFAMQPNAGWWWVLVAYLPESPLVDLDSVPEKRRAGGTLPSGSAAGGGQLSRRAARWPVPPQSRIDPCADSGNPSVALPPRRPDVAVESAWYYREGLPRRVEHCDVFVPGVRQIDFKQNTPFCVHRRRRQFVVGDNVLRRYG